MTDIDATLPALEERVGLLEDRLALYHLISTHGPSVVSSDGDTAVATGYSGGYRAQGDGFGVWRVSANRWEFVRGPDGWKATSRVNQMLDGSDTARAMLRQAVTAPGPGSA